MHPIRRRLFALAAALLLAGALPTIPAAAGELRIFAAASLKNALDEIAEQQRQETGRSFSISYAASSALAKQIESGAPADIFISADLEWMDYLDGRGLLAAGTRRIILGNSLVLVAPAGAAKPTAIGPGLDLAGLLGDGRLAIGNIDSVPAGKYAKASLQGLGLWDAVKDRLAQAENVRAALGLVARGEAPAGIVYATDARAEPKVAVVGTFPASSHPPILYPAAVVAASKSGDARAFVEYLASERAQQVFRRHGFGPPEG